MPTISQSTLIVSASSDLRALAESDCNSALWERQVPQGSREFFLQVLNHPIACSFEVVPAQARQRLEQHLATVLPQGLREHHLYTLWLNDLVELILSFGLMHRLDRVAFQLDTERPCQRFHADSLEMRLVCTYCGPGTIWLSDDNLNRQAAESRGTTNQEIAIDLARVRQLQEWDVFVMKGKRASRNPLYHKSPDPREGDPPSLILKLDKPAHTN